MTPCGLRRMSASNTTPFLPSSSRSPHQSPVSRGRDQKSPPQVGGTSYGCARDRPGTAASRAEPRRTANTYRALWLYARRGRRPRSMGPWSHMVNEAPCGSLHGDPDMSPLAFGTIVFACVLGGGLLGTFLRVALPERHLSAESKDLVRLAMGL